MGGEIKYLPRDSADGLLVVFEDIGHVGEIRLEREALPVEERPTPEVLPTHLVGHRVEHKL